MERIETVVVGGGQAGLATSYWLTQAGHGHVVLERSSGPANVWRNNRWDSFTMVTPNWATKMPGVGYDGPDPDGYMLRDEIIAYFTGYADRFQLPVRYGTSVTAVEPAGDRGYLVHTPGDTIEAANVVIATGFFQHPRTPGCAARLSPDITQVHSDAYRNPESLPEDAVLVVGSAMSGCQIAEELYLRGRKVYLSTGGAGRAPRRYRGKDVIAWLDQLGFFQLTQEQMPPGSTKFDAIPHLSGVNGGHTLNLHQFARDGVTLLGRLRDMSGHRVSVVPNLHQNLAQADGFEGMMVGMIDGYIEEHGLDIPAENLPHLRDGFDQSIVEELDLKRAGIGAVIWATGYSIDYSLVKLPVCDTDGFPIQDHGVTNYPGLYFVGMPWMPSESSGFLIGVGPAAQHIAASIADVAAVA
ncbi:MAG: NAD(P)-binding domain-containing protein [Chloroflexota bacterium]|nr:NAD(P)-binding domain-containing protein [Chloroflexota bacterium]